LSHSLVISIVTPCLNRVAFVAYAVESVVRQDYPALDHIIMDAGSSDGTLELLRRFPHLRVHSGPDEGIYDGLNKGVRIARGEVIGFLNTDDLYEPGVFESVAQAFEAAPEIDAVVGGASIFREEAGGEQTIVASFPCVAPGDLLMRATEGAPIFNAWFFRRRFLEELGGFDIRYLYAADRDLLIRMAFRGASYAGLNRPVYRYRMHPGSYTLSGQDSGEDPFMLETRALAERYLRLSDLGPEARKCLRRWHSQITLDHMWTAWRRRAYRRMFGYMLTGLRHNVAWPWLFAGKAIDRLIRTDSP
jgi:glycosyltransferase involved in cell wall biosynthesis